MAEHGKPRSRAIRIAAKVLASEGVVPARMTDCQRDQMWTLQWSELRVLALAVRRMMQKKAVKK